MANASTWLTAPDGDLAYFGRNQEQAWALGGTVYGSEVAAGLDESSSRAEGRYRALGTRALERLRDDHGVGRFGLNITPAVKESHKGGEKGADHGAGGPSFGALTLLFVDWSLPEIADADHKPTQIRSDTPSRALLSRGESRFAVVRTKNLWYAVRTTRGGKHPEELRDDFGLMALKMKGRDGEWKDVVRPRPITRGEGIRRSQPARCCCATRACARSRSPTRRACSATARSCCTAACAGRRTRSSGSSPGSRTGRSCARSTSPPAR